MADDSKTKADEPLGVGGWAIVVLVALIVGSIISAFSTYQYNRGFRAGVSETKAAVYRAMKIIDADGRVDPRISRPAPASKE